MICRAIDEARQQGRKGLVLTCKEKLVPYYAKFGFSDEGVSDKSTHGNVVWHQMRLAFLQVTPIKMVDFIIYSFYNYFIKRVQRGT